MRIKLSFCFVSIQWLMVTSVLGQSLPIVLDGRFEDWTKASVFKDVEGDGPRIDLVELALSNDADHLYLKIKVAAEFELTNNNKLSIYIDGDNNSLTGIPFNGIGADLKINTGDRNALFTINGFDYQAGLNTIKFLALPSVSGVEFEIALKRNLKLNNQVLLFTSGSIKLALKDHSLVSGDALPNSGTMLSYVFDDTPVAPFVPIEIEKTDTRHIRLLTYNVLDDGLDDLRRTDHFKRIIKALKPDIITFNECWNTPPSVVATFMNGILPLPGFKNWNAVKLDAGNITVSRFSFIEHWLIRQNSRITASLIDLPETYEKDMLLVNAHFRCCTDNTTRQLEADAFINFLLDAKNPGGLITIPDKTPVVLSGDLNLVEKQQQLTTLLTGQIVNTGTFGPGGAPDWDGSSLKDIVSIHSDRPVAYTWRDERNEFAPSRIDYHIITGSSLTPVKTFVLDTESMSPARLANYQLEKNDALVASDHLPKVTDFLIAGTTLTSEESVSEVKVFPNPFTHYIWVNSLQWPEKQFTVTLLDVNGKILYYGFSKNTDLHKISTGQLPAGFYFLVIKSGHLVVRKKMMKY